ncbi:MAG TPA: UDP-N-acetylmuramate--L-alanine ligase, partial [Armatimonadetes bacterium]|nr:UDP-N-acetylmuramate--L-alanine ligase [Armatimonadota bacterium]
ADESDGTFLKLNPAIAVVTNIDPEHLDHYGSFERLKETFCEFANKVPFYGSAILCLDHPSVREIMPEVKRRVITYGLSEGAEVEGRVLERGEWESLFAVYHKGKGLGRLRLRIPGVHNVQNALAAVACGLELDVPFERIREALEEFSGVERRLERKGEVRGVMVIDDYAHHPSEIKATLETVKALRRRVVAIFQPHRYSRMKLLFKDFLTCFDDADLLFLTEIYPAGETPIEGVNAEGLYRRMRERGREIHFVPARERLIEEVLPRLREGDLVITLGAGNIYETAEELLEALRR